jgi:hypothetical protein
MEPFQYWRSDPYSLVVNLKTHRAYKDSNYCPDSPAWHTSHLYLDSLCHHTRHSDERKSWG